jgi:hypothetical protein
MTIRTTTTTVTFTQPSSFDGIDGVLPPGQYEVDTDEELIENLSFLAYRRVATTLRLRRDGATQVHTIDPVELEANLLRDAGHTILPAAGD